ncbi:uncharacterized protein LOC119081785 [Bradysia coprophila]|uniref:uncharacterized protein LOC119081785 n=1 Tax=Bradysia coprophila TaxID=38358 RepID=UPI00187DBE0D|nr:uncharacterized protein LOC119081785 [Bradysia coprophila]
MTTFTNKVLIVSELARGMTPEFLAELHQTTEEEINRIDANHQLIVEVGHYFNISKDFPLMGGYYPRMENILFCWLADHRDVTNKALSEKARQIVDIIGERPRFSNVSAFTASQNWVKSFKLRYHGMSIDQSQGLIEDVRTEPVDEVKLEMDFETEAETMQSQDFVDEVSTVDELAEIINNGKRPAATNEIFNSLSEELMEPVSPNKDDRQMEASKIDERTESPTLIIQKRSGDPDECSSSEELVDSLSSVKRSLKRKISSIEHRSTDVKTEYSSEEEFDDSEPSQKRRRNSQTILVPTKTGVKSMNLRDYKEHKVIRIFKPLLKFAKDSNWSPEDSNQLDQLYRKSLLSCDGKEAKQTTITNFFRKKK